MSMQMQLFTQGAQVQALAAWAFSPFSHTFNVRLSTGALPNNDDTFPATYPEPHNAGYDTITVAFGGSHVNAADGACTLTLALPISWTFSAYSGTAETITFCWWEGYSFPEVLVQYGVLEPPYVIPFGGGTLTLTPANFVTQTCPAPGPAAWYVLDNFVGSNSTPLTSHVMDHGHGWVAEVGTFWIQSNKAVGESRNDGDQVITDGGLSRYQLLVDVVAYGPDASNYDHPGTSFRWWDTNNFWFVDVNPIAGLITLAKVVGGSISFPAGVSQSFASGSTHTLGARVNADTITVSWDGTDLFSYVDGFNELATGVGFRVAKNGTPAGQGSWSNLRVNGF